jgi:transcriptional regulator
LVHEISDVTRILQDYVTFYEQSMPQPWQFDMESDFARRLATQVVGFRVEISRWEAKWKLGQNHTASRRRRVIAALDMHPDNRAHEVADLMRAMLPEEDKSDLRPA